MENHPSNVINQEVKNPHTEMRLPVAYELELHRVIELAAYFMAESDGFKCPAEYYWFAAENEVQKYP